MGRLSAGPIRLLAITSFTLTLAGCSPFAAWAETPHDWAVTAIDGNTLTLVVAVGSSDCDRLERIDVFETATDVTITAVVAEREPGSGLFPAGCNDDLNVETVDVTLDGQLGDRTLSGCAPGRDGIQDYFRPTGARTSNDCAEIASW